MKAWYGVSILLLATVASACESLVAPEAEPAEPARLAAPTAHSSLLTAAGLPTAAGGAFTQTEITSLEVRSAGPNTILEQTAKGSISGTLTGAFEDDLRVVIHPNGRFTAKFTITCGCTVEGREGVLQIVAEDDGELVSPDLAIFAGRAVITRGTGELSGLQGVLEIEGAVNVTSGLSTYTYSGRIHFHP
jgi:hypothetical protein